MSTSSSTIIEQALARSVYNDEGVIAQDPEMVARINHRQMQLFRMVNERSTPGDAYFGTEVSVEFEGESVADGWPVPNDVDVLLGITVASGGGLDEGTEINLVPQDDRECEEAPRVYPRSRGRLYSVGLEGDPTTESLDLFYARFPTALDPSKAASHADNEIDAEFPEAFINLFVVDLALWLANKDARFQIDSRALLAEKEEGEGLYLAHTTGTHRTMRSRFGR